MNGTFSSVFVREDPGEDIPETESIYQGPELMEIDFSPDHVLKHLKKLKPNKAWCVSHGLDKMCGDSPYATLRDFHLVSKRK